MVDKIAHFVILNLMVKIIYTSLIKLSVIVYKYIYQFVGLKKIIQELTKWHPGYKCFFFTRRVSWGGGFGGGAPPGVTKGAPKNKKKERERREREKRKKKRKKKGQKGEKI